MNRDAAGTKSDASTGALSRVLPGCARHAAVRCASALLVLGTGAFVLAADSDNLYQAYTDEELSEIASDWQSLTTEERRDYFIEIRRRMGEAGKKREDPPRVVGERRFGRIIPQPDGSVLRIEGVVRYREGDATPNPTGDATGGATPPGYGNRLRAKGGADGGTAPASLRHGARCERKWR